MSRKSVVLPAPDGPVKNWNDCGPIVEADILQDLRPHPVA